MRLDPNHLVPATGAGARLPALLDTALRGQISHIVDGERVLAHLVPADSLVVGGPVEALLLGPAISAAAIRFADEVADDGYHHPGTAIGAILAWLWQSKTNAALHWFVTYTDELTAALTARRLSHPPFEPLWAALQLALNPNLAAAEIADFQLAARDRFGPEVPDRQGPDDPWPDVTPGGRCFAKRRWRDVGAGDFVPAHRDADLDYDDGWCRVEHLASDQAGALRVSVRDADGQRVVQSVGDTTMWVPFRGREPWCWGLPQ